MFWGCTLNKNKQYNLTASQEGIEVLHVSNAALPQKAPAGKTVVQAKVGSETFALCTLEKEKLECYSLGIYFRVPQKVTFSVNGPAEVHLTGYWEPTMDMLEEGADDAALAAEFEGEDEEDEAPAGLRDPPKEAKSKKNKEDKVKGKKEQAKGKQQQAKFLEMLEQEEEEEEEEEEMSEGEMNKIIARF